MQPYIQGLTASEEKETESCGNSPKSRPGGRRGKWDDLASLKLAWVKGMKEDEVVKRTVRRELPYSKKG